MTKRQDLYSIFYKPIGQNLDNDPNDIINTKIKLEQLGYLKDDIKNGYITRELNDGIHKFQKDKGLKNDGVIKPGGPTEATLFSDLFGINKQTPDEDHDRIAGVPLIIKALPHVARSGKKAWDAWQTWQKISPQQRQDEIDELYDQYYRDYETEVRHCNKVTKEQGKEAGQRCFAEAANKLADCQKEIKR